MSIIIEFDEEKGNRQTTDSFVFKIVIIKSNKTKFTTLSYRKVVIFRMKQVWKCEAKTGLD